MQFCRILLAVLSVLVFQACSLPQERHAAPSFSPGSQPESEASPDSRGSASRVTPKGRDNGTTRDQASPDDSRLAPVVERVPPGVDNRGEILHRIGPYDLLRITVFNVEELSGEERVSEDGKIILPLVGSIAVVGLTTEEAEQEVAKALGQTYLNDPQVDIFVVEYASLDVTVTGAVNLPGVYPITGRTTLLQAIALAEGLAELADDDNVIIFRGQGTPQTEAYVVSVEQIEKGRIPDPVLQGDDRIIVPESGSMAVVKGISDTLRGFIRITPFGR